MTKTEVSGTVLRSPTFPPPPKYNNDASSPYYRSCRVSLKVSPKFFSNMVYYSECRKNSLFPVKISRKVEEILFQQDKTEKLLRMAF